MKRLLAILALLVALVSLVVPSVAVGARGIVAHPSPTYVMNAQGQYIGGPCLLKPGKSAACPRPDLGVLPRIASARPVLCDTAMRYAADDIPASTLHRPGLPPPRTC